VNANPEFTSFARLVESLSPWLDQVVVIGGWAHRLHRFHPAAQALDYAPLQTLDADVALPTRFRVAGQELYDRQVPPNFAKVILNTIRRLELPQDFSGTTTGSSLVTPKRQLRRSSS